MPTPSPSNPFLQFLDAIPWRPLDPTDSSVTSAAPNLPHATHEGFLTIGGARLRVLQLSSGERIIDAADLGEVLGWGTANDSEPTPVENQP